jgi:TRAP-type C4-dicarboxylate transport system permease small subunit
MDLIQRILPPRAKNITNFTINIFSSGVSAILCYAAVYFVISEYHENQFISSINIPIWVIELIIPTGYAFISFYFFLNAISIIIQYAQRTSK